ncbi:Methylthioribose-1-phosphate isomerase [Serratia rubidaea]|uniref:Methylthioribose-1-phosphate isomerase n=1 Tax=Serratia rubidaea TaxID=61652 RepID=A0A447QPX4_SERRU|nr:Methylthioribose-1-phosphate isomerase [Serratia rubidaea]
MRPLNTTSLTLRDNRLWILDQQALPQEKRWLASDSVEQLVGHIHALRVRGAPLIGLSASLLLALLAERGLPHDDVLQALGTLRAARPTAVNLMNNLDRIKLALTQPDWRAAVAEEAWRLVEEDRALCDRIADHGAALVAPGSRLLTHCNTGGLATAGIGTAIGVLLRAHQQGKVAQVWVDETRPLLQGGRLTAWELGELQIPYRLICDSMAASLMAQGQVDAVWVGATASPPTATSPTRSAPTAWRCWPITTAFRFTSPRRIPRTIRPAPTAPPFRLSSAPPRKSPASAAASVSAAGRRMTPKCITGVRRNAGGAD